MEASKDALSDDEQQLTSPDEARSRMRAGLDPRKPIERDPFNEYFVFALSATGAALIAPLLIYIVMAIVGETFHVIIFIAAAVLVELILIFVFGRPQMKPRERVGWALLWGFTTAVLALCFYYLVAEPTLG